jgi:KTSC domain-containing protein
MINMKMEMIPVSSSNIASIGYDPERKELEVAFKGGATYRYHGVEEDTFLGLKNAKSAGGFFHLHVISRYHHRKL